MVLLPPGLLGLLFVSYPLVYVANCESPGIQRPIHESLDKANDQGLENGPFHKLDAQRGWGFNFSSASPHYFSSVHGLLQQWPNTFFPNGHVIATAEIPTYTNLYHGRHDDELPPSPEWFAFDMYVTLSMNFKHKSPNMS